MPGHPESWAAGQAGWSLTLGLQGVAPRRPEETDWTHRDHLHTSLSPSASDPTDALPHIKADESTLNILYFEGPFDSKPRPPKHLCRKITSICHGILYGPLIQPGMTIAPHFHLK